MRMIANVNEQMWIDYDLDIAVFLDTIAYWIKKNAANKQERNFHEGRYWTYNSQEAFQKMFPGWKRETIRRIIRNCVKHGLLIVGNFNKKSYDRTGWYSLTDKAVKYYPYLYEIMAKPADNPSPASSVEINQPCVEINPAIPTLLPSSSNNTITTSSSSKSDYESNNTVEEFGENISEEGTDLDAKSDYHNNRIKNNTDLSNTNHNVTVDHKYKFCKAGKVSHTDLMVLIDIYREEFPNNPQPHKTLISTSLEKVLRTLIKRWPEADPKKRPIDLEAFRRYLQALKTLSPKFALGE
jgi:hypothetical protein